MFNYFYQYSRHQLWQESFEMCVMIFIVCFADMFDREWQSNLQRRLINAIFLMQSEEHPKFLFHFPRMLPYKEKEGFLRHAEDIITFCHLENLGTVKFCLVKICRETKKCIYSSSI